MCGINGIINIDKSKVEENDLLVMNKLLAHRGPDSQEIYIDKNVGLGHVRLSIIDTSNNGKQPMSSDDGRYTIIFNGEIYNYLELKKELKQERFVSKTDTEIILYLYKEQGPEMVKKLNGMFAIAIYDKEKEELFLARDRLGIKPIYYSITNRSIIFSSEIKALVKTKIKPEINKESLKEYLMFQNTFGTKTMFENVSQLKAGTYNIINVYGEIKTTTFWDVKFKYKRNNKSFSELLDHSVKRQLMSDVPIGTYLSGGFDSSSVTIKAAKYHKNIHTFTGAFEEGAEYDERKYSKIVAQKANANLHEKIITSKDFIENINKIIYHLDEPTKVGRSFSTYHVAKLAKKNVTVTLTGHGGDELFAGYPTYIVAHYKDRIKKNPFSIVGLIKELITNPLRLNIAFYFFGGLFNPATKMGLLTIFSDKELQVILQKPIAKQIEQVDPIINCKELLPKMQMTEAEKTQYLYLRTYLPSLFMVEDRISMAHSIESRVPICDNELIDYSISLRINDKLKGNELKHIIKQSMKKELPIELYQNSKKGFPTPLKIWFEKELKSFLENKLFSEKMKELFDEDQVRKLLEKRKNTLVEQKIWTLLNIAIWLEEYFEK